MRTTAKDVGGMYCRMVNAAESVGLDVSGWALIQGSTTYGRAWRVYRVDPTSGGHHDFLGSDGYLGLTTRSAYESLHAMARALELVAKVQS